MLGHCLGSFSQHGSLFAAFFLAGLTGGLTHCISMCGPIVVSEALTTCRSGCVTGCNKITAARYYPMFSYHLGRAVTYGGLGFVAAFLSKQIAAIPAWPWISAVMLGCAGLMFVISGIPGCKHKLFQPSGKIHFMRGILLGFMPCGLLYAALMMAATLANPFSGMLAMWLFVLGTVPVLLLARIGAEFMTHKWHVAMRNVGQAMMVFNGLLLMVIAARNVI